MSELHTAAPLATPPDVDLDDDAQVDRALRAAVCAALRDHQRTGDFVVSWQNNQVVRLPAQEILLPEEDL